MITYTNRCLHETRMENAQVGLKSSRPLDRTDYLQTGTHPERDECEHKYISDRLSCALCFETTHARQSPAKTTMAGKGNKSKDMRFSYRSHVNDADNFDFHPGLMD